MLIKVFQDDHLFKNSTGVGHSLRVYGQEHWYTKPWLDQTSLEGGTDELFLTPALENFTSVGEIFNREKKSA